jgi:LysR family glycine cleavage system transcriptional activator
MTGRQIPPLNALRAFEAAARHESMGAAASELFVTHGAVSRQVRVLETWLGIALFERRGRRIALTLAGRQYRAEIEAALDRVHVATANLRARGGGGEILVSSPPTLTMHWLLPRLSHFQVMNPGISVRFHNSSAQTERAEEPHRYDLTIARQLNAYAAEGARRVLRETCTPVCSPALAAPDALRSPADLQNHVWLSSELREKSWKEWLACAGKPRLKPRQSLHFPQFYVALQAAIDGLGVAIGPLPLIEKEIRSGRLVTPFPRVVSRAYSYFAITPAHRSGDANVARLTDWLLKEGRTSS